MSVRSFIDINQYSYNRGKKTASLCYAGMCGSMQATISWAHRYGKKDTDFALKVLENSVNEQKKVRNVIKRFNRRFG
jgi:hypothetical protein